MTSNTASGDDAVALVLNRDLMFGSRIRNALAQIGLKTIVAPDSLRLADAMREHGDDAVIAIIDMNGPVDWDTIRHMIERAGDVPTLAFGPHVDVEVRRAAKAAGVSRIVSNGQFHSDMISLIERYRRR